MKRFLKNLKEIKAKREARKKEELNFKKNEIINAVIQFFIDKDRADGIKVNIMPCIRANQVVANKIKNDKDIEYYYSRLLEYRKNINFA